MTSPDLTILIATYRRSGILERTLDALARMEAQAVRWKLVLIDNAGDAATRAVVDRYRNRLPIELLPEPRRGKNHALNTGLEHAEGGLYVFTDDDCMPAPDWLSRIVEGTRRWPDATIFTGRIIPSWPEGTHPLPLRTDLLRSAYMVTSWGDREGPISADRAWGCNLAIRAWPFQEGCRFDPTIGPAGKDYAMGSELELTRRLSASGHETIYLPDAVVSHQIRPEQMEERWLTGRAYRSGRGVARLQGVPPVPRWLGAPRFVYRELATHGLDWLRGWLSRDPDRRVDGKLGYHHWRGKLREYRRMHADGQG